MKNLIVMAMALMPMLSACGGSEGEDQLTNADLVVRRQTMGGVCHVQKRTASPIGPQLSGPHATLVAACNSAKDLYDSSFEQANRCWSYGGGTVRDCKTAGVDLPN